MKARPAHPALLSLQPTPAAPAAPHGYQYSLSSSRTVPPSCPIPLPRKARSAREGTESVQQEPATPEQGAELCPLPVQPISTFSDSKMGTGFPARPAPWDSQALRAFSSFPAASASQGSHLLPAASRACLGVPCCRAGTAPARPRQPPCPETCDHSVPFVLSTNNG